MQVNELWPPRLLGYQSREGFMDVQCHFYIFIACFDKLMQILFGPRGDTIGGGAAAAAPVTA